MVFTPACTTFYSNGECRWPVAYKPEEIAKATRNLEKPGDGWESFRVSILYKADSYTSARLKFSWAETYTDLQTAEDDTAEEIPKKSKRRKRPKSRWLEDESDEELPQKQTKKLPQAPRIKPSTYFIVKAETS